MIKQQFTNMFSNICKKLHTYTQREDGKLYSKLLTVIVFEVGFVSSLHFFTCFQSFHKLFFIMHYFYNQIVSIKYS